MGEERGGIIRGAVDGSRGERDDECGLAVVEDGVDWHVPLHEYGVSTSSTIYGALLVTAAASLSIDYIVTKNAKDACLRPYRAEDLRRDTRATWGKP